MSCHTVVRHCPLCAADNTACPPTAWSRPPWRIKRCGTCTLVYLENAVPYQELEENLAWTKTSALERQRRREVEPIFSRLSAALKRVRIAARRRNKMVERITAFTRHGNVLDIGCGSGGTLAQLPETLIPFGVEIDRTAAEAADHRFQTRGGRAIQAAALAGLRSFDSRQFECILLQSYLEHELEPLPVLREVSRLLAPRGRAIIKVPNFGCWNRRLRGNRWCGFRFPDHVNYFTPATLDAAINAAGLQCVDHRFSDRLPTSDNMWAEVCRVPAPALQNARTHTPVRRPFSSAASPPVRGGHKVCDPAAQSHGSPG